MTAVFQYISDYIFNFIWDLKKKFIKIILFYYQF